MTFRITPPFPSGVHRGGRLTINPLAINEKATPHCYSERSGAESKIPVLLHPPFSSSTVSVATGMANYDEDSNPIPHRHSGKGRNPETCFE